ncbi:hypothetical protein J7J47_12350 [Halomonas sp. ISL-60]|uniref:hypothetical protein n=1 Tax=Halomonas sp. ISL-56 TaxID=2819149 RepID=UPI001BEC020E|nr:hypothetical protein [Halomonas sp. ISL-56]MBT2773013.1 hypothetical protein [Halomonas sp. ISL-60]MBT2800824.1 hypothetical protein [Halomonas sp. ISL-56]
MSSITGKTLSMLEDRQDFGEERIITVGRLTGKAVTRSQQSPCISPTRLLHSINEQLDGVPVKSG